MRNLKFHGDIDDDTCTLEFCQKGGYISISMVAPGFCGERDLILYEMARLKEWLDEAIPECEAVRKKQSDDHAAGLMARITGEDEK